MRSEQLQPQRPGPESSRSHNDEAQRPTVVFLFAHQDDEALIFPRIEQAIFEGNRVLCIYLTNGNFAANRNARRDAESRRVLSRIGVDPNDIYFVGSMRGFLDGALLDHLDDALAAMSAILSPLSDIRNLYMHAWEGGHQDHDAVHLIGVTYAAKAGLIDVCRQFAAYRAAPNPLGLTIFAPLAENGAVSAEPIPLAARLRYLSLNFSYPSQWKTWIVLFPLIVFSYWTKPIQEVQGVSILRLLARPHAGPLLYERRNRMTYEQFQTATNFFLQRHLPQLFSESISQAES
jgi:LmbE family N-acetylglucosaminyl deacetylase